MSKIPFTVSARTARLIGQENFANAEGAIIELVKNSYDADATVCMVIFDVKYAEIPDYLSLEEYNDLVAVGKDIIEKCYQKQEDESFRLLESISSENRTQLILLLRSMSSIYIIDNGDGMDDGVIKKYWMTIGTDQKLNDVFSKSGRVRAGAKGIGRFSLDRLGNTGQMITFPRDKVSGYDWRVKWSDFEKDNAVIGEIMADLDTIEKSNYKNEIVDFFHNKKIKDTITKSVSKFSQGTLLKIGDLRDSWSEKTLNRLYSNLEILTPPDGQKKFQVFLYSAHDDTKYGKIDNSDFSDFDYRVQCEYLADDDKLISLKFEREEFDETLIENDVFELEDMNTFPFDKKTFKKKKFELKIPIYDLLPGFKEKDKNQTLDKVGKFKFGFYFLKNQQANSEDQEKYFYRTFDGTKRSQWLDKFGGIRVFIDNFRIRPYGEPKTNSFDWLSLGDRYGQDPSGIARKGRWRVRPNQIAGSIHLSRTTNLYLKEKSNREGFQENEVFDLFKTLLIALIKKFEDDRSTLGFNFDQYYKAKTEEEQAEQEASEIVDNEEGELETEESSEELKKQNVSLKKGFKSQRRKLAQKDEELKLSRALASAGLMIAAFTHEFNSLSRKLGKRSFELKKYLEKLLPEENITNIEKHHNPYHLIEGISKQDEKLKQWVDFSLSLVRKDKRRTNSVSIKKFFHDLKDPWESLLAERDTSITIDFDIEQFEDVTIKIYELDMDTIFDNLLTNTVEAFQTSGFAGKREIKIDVVKAEKSILFKYRDSGPGLDEAYKKSPKDIFKPFETSKRDDDGNPTGTGLGMWLVKSVIDEYKGSITIPTLKKGFGVNIRFDKGIRFK